MEGITILNTTPIMDGHCEALFIACSIILAFGAAIFILSLFDKIKLKVAIPILIICLLIYLGGMIVDTSTHTFDKPTGKNTYDVLIEDSVGMKEFYEKYEVIEVNGEIWTIQDKE